MSSKRFKQVDPTGFIKEFRRPTKEEWEVIKDAEVLHEYNDYPDEWHELLEDPDPDVYVLETTDGTFFLISQNDNGHGALTIVKGD
jgi:hypothetical protein